MTEQQVLLWLALLLKLHILPSSLEPAAGTSVFLVNYSVSLVIRAKQCLVRHPGYSEGISSNFPRYSLGVIWRFCSVCLIVPTGFLNGIIGILQLLPHPQALCANPQAGISNAMFWNLSFWTIWGVILQKRMIIATAATKQSPNESK